MTAMRLVIDAYHQKDELGKKQSSRAWHHAVTLKQGEG